mmetsp:Transcript_36456/g.67878  ORF Transcript_36456/g.67878 Transcript_36456/m.67878 type:complete len:216 (-) Transcript_36456:358-1005(-)
MMSTGRSSFVRDDRNVAAALNRSVCTSRISDRIARRAVSCTGAKLLCRAKAARPTDAKNLCSEKPTDTKAARQLLSSCGAKVISLEDISLAAAVKKTLESWAKSGARLLFGSADHAATVLQDVVNCMLVSSRRREPSNRQSSARKSPPWWSRSPWAASIFCTRSVHCWAVKDGNLIKISRATCSTDSGSTAACARESSASNWKSACVRMSSPPIS